MIEKQSKLPNPAFVLGGSLNALGIIRALGREGVPVFQVYHSRDTIASASRYARFLLSPHPENQPDEFLRFLLGKVPDKQTPGVLIPTSDMMALFLARYGEQLTEHFRFVLPDSRLIEKFASKEGFDELALQHDFPVPQTFVPKSIQDVEEISRKLDYPCIIKPFYSHKWRDPRIVERYGWIKVLQINNEKELREHYAYLAQVDPRVVIQEYIHGDDASNFSLHIYISRTGEKVITFVGQKIRVAPIHYGVGACVRSVREPEMEELGKNFLLKVGYRGMAVINFKKDPIRKKIYGIELNPRFSLWNYLDYASGINFAYLYYLDSLGFPLPDVPEYQENVKWISIEKDLSALFSYRKEGAITFREWLRSYQGKKAFAEFAMDDPLPFVKWIGKMSWIVLSGGSRRIFKKFFCR